MSRYIYLLFFITIFSVSGCGEKIKAAKEEAIPVRAEKVALRDIQTTLDYSGNIKAQEEAAVYPKVSGKILEKVKEEGAVVEKGDIVAYIDRDEVGFKFEKAPVESPLTGIIGRVYVDIGSSVSPATPIALVVYMDNVKISLDIPEKYLSKIMLGQSAEINVDAYPAETFKGEISKISPVVDQDTRTAPIEINIKNKEHKLKSGMFARVSLVIDERKSVPAILKEAIIGREPDTYVYTVREGKAFLKKVSLGLRQDQYVEVKEGLGQGEEVVVMGQQRLKDAVSVKTEE
ncbi:MAG: efflux RND transporter periplasmic adaptor subunit [Candidatus Omnitrophota bacterium]|jgi:multidrug efflux pump subunit AcrA (membrane-fusion protein)